MRYLDVKKIFRIGIDRITLSGFYLLIEDMEKIREAEEKDNVKIIWNQESPFGGIQYLKICDNNKFQTFTVSYRHIKKNNFEKRIITSHLDITVSNICKSKTNITNLSLDEYKAELKNIYKYIREKYGIFIKDTYSYFTYIEINCNLFLDKKFEDYEQVIELMLYNLSNAQFGEVIKEYKAIDKLDNSLKIETVSRANNRFEIQIYNKTKQLATRRNPFKCNEQIMRVEFKLKNTQKIKESLVSNILYELTDDTIVKYFHDQFYKLFVKQFYNLKDETDKKLLSMCKKNMSMKKHWICGTLQDCIKEERKKHVPIIIDIYQYIEIVNMLSEHKNRNKEKILKYNQEYGNISENNIELIQEIIAKEEDAYNNSCQCLAEEKCKIS